MNMMISYQELVRTFPNTPFNLGLLLLLYLLSFLHDLNLYDYIHSIFTHSITLILIQLYSCPSLIFLVTIIIISTSSLIQS